MASLLQPVGRGHNWQPHRLRWEGEKAQAGKHGPQSQTKSSKHVAGMRSVAGRAGICKQRECQANPEEAAEAMGAGCGGLGAMDPIPLCGCGVIRVTKARRRPSLTDRQGSDLV